MNFLAFTIIAICALIVTASKVYKTFDDNLLIGIYANESFHSVKQYENSSLVYSYTKDLNLQQNKIMYSLSPQPIESIEKSSIRNAVYDGKTAVICAQYATDPFYVNPAQTTISVMYSCECATFSMTNYKFNPDISSDIQKNITLSNLNNPIVAWLQSYNKWVMFVSGSSETDPVAIQCFFSENLLTWTHYREFPFKKLKNNTHLQISASEDSTLRLVELSRGEYKLIIFDLNQKINDANVSFDETIANMLALVYKPITIDANVSAQPTSYGWRFKQETDVDCILRKVNRL